MGALGLGSASEWTRARSWSSGGGDGEMFLREKEEVRAGILAMTEFNHESSNIVKKRAASFPVSLEGTVAASWR